MKKSLSLLSIVQLTCNAAFDDNVVRELNYQFRSEFDLVQHPAILYLEHPCYCKTIDNLLKYSLHFSDLFSCELGLSSGTVWILH